MLQPSKPPHPHVPEIVRSVVAVSGSALPDPRQNHEPRRLAELRGSAKAEARQLQDQAKPPVGSNDPREPRAVLAEYVSEKAPSGNPREKDK
jgi:hypothetical protein